MIIAQVNGIELAYERRGRGPALVLLHGYPLDHSIWHETASLLGTSFDVVLVDLRGFGESSAPETDYGMGDMAADVAGLLDHLGVERAAIAGHSMGGYVALAFVRAYPDRTSALGLISSQAVADTPEAREKRYSTASQIAEHGLEPIAGSMPAKLSGDERVRGYCEALIRQQRPAGLIGALKAMAGREDLQSWLTAVDIPMCVVHGNADALIPVDRGREAAAANPRARLTELAGIGHMPMMENPQVTAGALRGLG